MVVKKKKGARTRAVAATEYAEMLAEIKKQIQEAHARAVLVANQELIKPHEREDDQQENEG